MWRDVGTDVGQEWYDGEVTAQPSPGLLSGPRRLYNSFLRLESGVSGLPSALPWSSAVVSGHSDPPKGTSVQEEAQAFPGHQTPRCGPNCRRAVPRQVAHSPPSARFSKWGLRPPDRPCPISQKYGLQGLAARRWAGCGCAALCAGSRSSGVAVHRPGGRGAGLPRRPRLPPGETCGAALSLRCSPSQRCRWRGQAEGSHGAEVEPGRTGETHRPATSFDRWGN